MERIAKQGRKLPIFYNFTVVSGPNKIINLKLTEHHLVHKTRILQSTVAWGYGEDMVEESEAIVDNNVS